MTLTDNLAIPFDLLSKRRPPAGALYHYQVVLDGVTGSAQNWAESRQAGWPKRKRPLI